MTFPETILRRGRQFIALTLRYSAAIMFVLLFMPLALSAASLKIEGERAWLEADNESLSEVMQLFEERGIEVIIDPLVRQPPISGNWRNTEIDWLIARLASPYSYALEWRMQKSPLGDLVQVASIRIFPEGKTVVAQSPSSKERVLDVVEGENGVKYIRGEIIIGFSREASVEDLNELLNKLQASVIEVIDPPGLYRLKVNREMTVEEAIRIAQEQNGISAAEPNLAIPKIVSTPQPLGEAGEGVNLSLFPGETVVAVFDSGIDTAYAEYPFIQDTYNAIDPGAEMSDPTGHGTLSSLIAAGAITPLGEPATESGVPVLSVRIFDENGMTSSDTVMRALEYASNSGVKIVSMSWGTEVTSDFLETSMFFAAQKGMTLYAAAGNEPTGTPVYPAGYDSVIGVGGLNPDGSTWEDSNYGDFVEHYEPAFANFNDQPYAGTSIASPYAAFKAAQKASK